MTSTSPRAEDATYRDPEATTILNRARADMAAASDELGKLRLFRAAAINLAAFNDQTLVDDLSASAIDVQGLSPDMVQSALAAAMRIASEGGLHRVGAEPPRPLTREVPPPEAFPVDALGDILGSAVRAINDRIQAPIALAAQSVLAVSTLAAQALVDVLLPIGPGRAKPISNYFISVATSGERKSACDNEAMSAVAAHEAALRQQYDAGLLDHLNDKTAWEKARETALKRCKGDRAAIKEILNELGPAPESPLHPMMLLPEPTFEGLVKHFAVGQANLGLFSGEGGQFIGGYSMADERKLATAAGLSALWDGEPIRRVRASDGALTLSGRRLAVHLMVQPEVANILLSDQLLAGQGLLSRLLVTSPESTIGARLWRDEKPETDRDLCRYNERILSILKIPTAAAKTNELKPRALPLSVQARKLFKRWHDHVEGRIAPGGELEPIKGFANKLPEHATRLAAVSTIIADVHAAEIRELELQAGLTLAEYYATEALRLFSVSRINADLQLARKLLHWLHSQWSEPAISLPVIYQRGPRPIDDQATARKLVMILQDHGFLRKLEGGATVAGHRRRDAWGIVRG